MALKDEWKETGKDLGHAFAGLAKNILRSAKDGVDIVAGDEDESVINEDGSSVNSFNDGSWRETGKELGKSFMGLGRSIIHSAQTGVEILDEVVEEEAQKDSGDAPAE